MGNREEGEEVLQTGGCEEGMRVFSFGGGVQSMAALVLAAEGRVRYDAFLFCNVGDDSEHPKTLVYVREHAIPFAAKHDIPFHTLQKTKRNGDVVTLLASLQDSKRSIKFPMRMSNGAPGIRDCTENFKIRVVDKWLKKQGATIENPATVGIGFSLDEIHRIKDRDGDFRIVKEYPLIDMRLNRSDCRNVISGAGLPVPPKSACWFCPYHRIKEWQRMKQEEPELFQKSVELERLMIERRTTLGKDAVWMTAYGQPLDTVISDQTLMDFDDSCESGYCMT